jgi:hypothetical protein
MMPRHWCIAHPRQLAHRPEPLDEGVYGLHIDAGYINHRVQANAVGIAAVDIELLMDLNRVSPPKAASLGASGIT